MSDAEDDLFGSSPDEGGDTDEIIANSKSTSKPVARKKAKPKKLGKAKTAAANSTSKKRKIPDADNDSDDDDGGDLFDDTDDEAETTKKKKKKAPAKAAAAPPKPKTDSKPLTKRERMEALQKKKRAEMMGSKSQKSSSSTASASKSRRDSTDKGDGSKEGGYDSGDSYDSAQFERTKEDNDFIDVDDDDEEALKELYAEQHFDDERPDGEDDEDERPKKGKGKASKPRKRGPDAVSDDEEGGPQNPIMEAVNKMKRKKKTQKKLSELEEEAKAFIERMEAAADDDLESIKAKSPATKKLAMLSEVVDMLTRRDVMRSLLELDVLSSCKKWIMPLPNGKLGNVTVRQRIIESVANMNGEDGIQPYHLKRSEFGKVVMALYKHKSETPTLKRQLKTIIEQWSRPIFQKSGNMKDLEQAQASRPVSSYARSPTTQQRHNPRSGDGTQQDLSSIIASGKQGGQKDAFNRVRVPFSKGFQFTVRPQGKSGSVADKRMSGPKDGRGDLEKRMVEKTRAVAKNQRSANISVEGRPVK